MIIDKEHQKIIDRIKFKLSSDDNGKTYPTYGNLEIIFNEDPYLKDFFQRDKRTNIIHHTRSPFWNTWNHELVFDEHNDYGHLEVYLELFYKIYCPQKLRAYVKKEASNNYFHPIKNYLDKLKWDGVSRLETLFIDYIHAEDNSFNRSVTRNAFVAAVRRIYEPGYKHDNLIVLIGRQGIGKSFLLSKMGKEWFNDSVDNLKGDEFYIQIANSWIVEFSELTAFSTSKIERIKQITSSTHDTYRAKYGRSATKNPRESIFFGTTNDEEFLIDRTGNRRFIPMRVGINSYKKYSIGDLTEDIVDQIWAEAKYYHEQGVSTHLNEQELEELKVVQEPHEAQDELELDIVRFILMKLPENWDYKSMSEKRDYVKEYQEDLTELGNYKNRDKISAREIKEILLKDESVENRKLSKRINECLKEIFNISKFSKVLYPKHFGQQRGIELEEKDLEELRSRYKV